MAWLAQSNTCTLLHGKALKKKKKKKPFTKLKIKKAKETNQ